ncbi:MAG: pyruvate kinase [Candidatus Palauibacterales bacterium]|nr:pyruvate kinase [Candidatus Palauibacterales bacterium]
MIRRAKIICTIGPASRDPETFRLLVDAGMDAVRVNFSHSSHEDAAETFRLARETARDVGRPLAVLADLQGPKIRVGVLPEPRSIEQGRTYVFEALHDADAGASGGAIPITYPDLTAEMEPGDRLLFDDGAIAFVVEETDGTRVTARARTNGTLQSRKGLNLPGKALAVPSITEKDRLDLQFALEHGVDYVALSFVRRAADLEELRGLVSDDVLIIAKIEKEQAVQNLAEIVSLSDGVMVARGDLGVELDFEEVPIVQKRLLRLSQESISIGITATQMLESMTHSPRPTRAEVSDVANALLDGTDVVMLSGETAVGDYPVEAVQTMDRVARRIESETGFLDEPSDFGPRDSRSGVHRTVPGAIAGAAVEATHRLGAPFLITLTTSGFTARLIAAQRPRVPILAVTDNERTYRQLALAWGVVPIHHDEAVSYDGMLSHARTYAFEHGLAEPGRNCVVTAGMPFHEPGTTNYMRVEKL